MFASQKYSACITVEGTEVPVQVILERRMNTRFSITRKQVILRMPMGQSAGFVQHQMTALQQWVHKQVIRKPALRAYFQPKSYQTGDVLQVGARKYWLEINLSDRATHTARLIGDTICVSLSTRSAELQRNRSIKTLLSRVVAGDFYPEMVERVHAINRRSVNRPITNIYLKYNHSNWGSCSANGNVNLSTRLLFAPEPVQDYVILHELTHLLEMNHSDRFWALVESFMPDYAQKERWLKQHGPLCDF